MVLLSASVWSGEELSLGSGGQKERKLGFVAHVSPPNPNASLTPAPWCLEDLRGGL